MLQVEPGTQRNGRRLGLGLTITAKKLLLTSVIVTILLTCVVVRFFVWVIYGRWWWCDKAGITFF